MKPLIHKNQILDIIPQRPPMVMVDELIAVDEPSATTTFEVTADNIFLLNGRFLASGLLENMAQTAASKAGYFVKTKGMAPQLGFIGGISKVEILNEPAVGDVIQTEVVVKNEIFGVTLVACTSHVGAQLVAKCEMKIVIQNG